jgi:hypothetical protein
VAEKVKVNRLRLMTRPANRRDHGESKQPAAIDEGQQGCFRVVRAVLASESL